MPTGSIKHTKALKTFELSERLHVVDFPGSNSLDNHSETFANCGLMNNLIILVVAYDGDITEEIGKEIANIFKTSHYSDCTKVTNFSL